MRTLKTYRMLALCTVALTFAFVSPGPRRARRHEVEIRAFQFKPQELRVAPGDTIVFVNRDPVPHTATASNRSWDTGELAPATSKALVVRELGELSYTCLYHLNMKAKLVVKGRTH